MLRPMLIAAVLLAATAPTACRDTATQAGGAATGLVTSRAADHGRPSPSVTLRWNGITRDYVTSLTAKPSQQAVLRDFAYLSLAQYEALTTARHSKHEEGGAARVQGAIVGASLAVLQSLLPAGATQFANEAAADRSAAAAVGEQDAFDAGVTLGRSIGTDVIASASTDRFNAVWTGTVPVGPGLWFSSANPAAPPQLPLLGQMRPFFMASGDQFRPPPPPTFRSPEYLAFLAEVRHFSDTRTAEQLAIAKFWAQTTGSLTAGFWNEEAARVAQQNHLSERRVARTLALANPDFSPRVGIGWPVVLRGVVWYQRRIATACVARVGGSARPCLCRTCGCDASKDGLLARTRSRHGPGASGARRSCTRVQRGRVTIGADSRGPARRAPRADSRSRGRARLCAPSRESARRS